MRYMLFTCVCADVDYTMQAAGACAAYADHCVHAEWTLYGSANCLR